MAPPAGTAEHAQFEYNFSEYCLCFPAQILQPKHTHYAIEVFCMHFGIADDRCNGPVRDLQY